MIKKIKVNEYYQGYRTQERKIIPGEYSLNDKRLFGLGQFLIDSGRATILEIEDKPSTKRTYKRK